MWNIFHDFKQNLTAIKVYLISTRTMDQNSIKTFPRIKQSIVYKRKKKKKEYSLVIESLNETGIGIQEKVMIM